MDGRYVFIDTTTKVRIENDDYFQLILDIENRYNKIFEISTSKVLKNRNTLYIKVVGFYIDMWDYTELGRIYYRGK